MSESATGKKISPFPYPVLQPEICNMIFFSNPEFHKFIKLLRWMKTRKGLTRKWRYFFSSSGFRHSENLKRILGTLEGRWLHKNVPKFPKILKVFHQKGLEFASVFYH
jgi:hypothetical protein